MTNYRHSHQIPRRCPLWVLYCAKTLGAGSRSCSSRLLLPLAGALPPDWPCTSCRLSRVSLVICDAAASDTDAITLSPLARGTAIGLLARLLKVRFVLGCGEPSGAIGASESSCKGLYTNSSYLAADRSLSSRGRGDWAERPPSSFAVVRGGWGSRKPNSGLRSGSCCNDVHLQAAAF